MYSSILRKVFLPYLLRRDGRQSALAHWNALEGSQFWPLQKLLDYQWENLKRLIRYSYDNCPYYTDAFGERGLTPDSIKDFSDLSLIPILTRDIIFEQGKRILSRSMPESEVMEFSTGGTTGRQATMYRDRESFNIKLGLEWRHDGWMGRRPCDKMVYFWPAHIDFVENETWRMKVKNRYFLRNLVFNAGTFREDAMRRFHSELSKFRPRFMKVFPASLYYFTSYLEQGGLALPPIDAIMSTGETLYEYQKAKFEEFYGCPVFDMYGSRETGNTASECSKHAGMHIAMETSYVEFLADGKPAKYGQEGEIIITDLTNFTMPLLRYKINDHGVPLKEGCPCGRPLPLMSTVIGRLQDDIWGPDGTRHSGNVLGIHLTVEDDGVSVGQVQFIQKSPTHFHIKLAGPPEPGPEVFDYITRRIRSMIGEVITTSFEVVDNIPREKSGKIRYVICEIDPPPGATL